MASPKKSFELITEFIRNKYKGQFISTVKELNKQYKPNLDQYFHVHNLIRLFRDSCTTVSHDIYDVHSLLESLKRSNISINEVVPIRTASSPGGVVFIANSPHSKLYIWTKEACKTLGLEIWEYKPKGKTVDSVDFSKSGEPSKLQRSSEKDTVAELKKIISEKNARISKLENELEDLNAYNARLKMARQSMSRFSTPVKSISTDSDMMSPMSSSKGSNSDYEMSRTSISPQHLEETSSLFSPQNKFNGF